MSIQVGYIPRDISDFMYEVLCRDNTFPWFYQEQTSFYNGTAEVLQLDGYEEHPYFAHTIVTDNQIKSNAYDIVFDKFWKWMVKNVDGDFGELIRVRAAKTMKNKVPPTQPHVDAPFGHWVMIYYCDNSDGPTTIYKERYGENPENVRPKQYIDPEKGKYVIFDGRMYHSGNAPRKHSSRTILNINYYGHTRILPS
ncbi:MAG: hypothetical protein CM15mV15_0280 [uncultured marine virus]|jgi:hypothetical protein|nr:MAG: hypothetical protein CM15mV15_0280 [uncultured marine virus]|tara:strand:+ start:1534 stop:2121 length:588 start_codon:yes stop_codon:yes gene_type:complete